jgi:5-methylcytosine-specific restriction endonuclease McrA
LIWTNADPKTGRARKYPKPDPIICGGCGNQFQPRLKTGGIPVLGCSRVCGAAIRHGRTTEQTAVSKTLRWAIKNAQRRNGIQKDPVPYTLAEISERDHHQCQLCHTTVDMTLSGMHPDGPTIDHVIPLVISRDDRRHNVQLAHRRCNLAKHWEPQRYRHLRSSATG